MFMTRDALDGPVGPPWDAPGTGEDQARPLMAGGGGSRPGTAGGGDSHGAEDGEDNSTPMSAAGRMQKMQQQRARMLQKQRSTLSQPGAAGSMVQANDSVPITEANRFNMSGRLNTAGARSSESSTAAPPSTLSGPAGVPVVVEDAAYEVLQAPSTASFATHATEGDGDDDNDVNAAVMPCPEPVQVDTKEEEERRRAALQERLKHSGMTTEFDPTPPRGSNGPPVAMGPVSTFDIGSIARADMRNFLLNPSPKNAGMVECRIIRERGGLSKLFPKYILQSESGVFLMSAKKQTHNKTSNYTITMAQSESMLTKDSDQTLGKLRSDFLGLEFVAYGSGMNPKKIETTSSHNAIQLAREELLAVQYSSSLWGSKPRGPRKMTTTIPRVQPNGERLVCRTLTPDQDGLAALHKANTATALSHIDVYHNKPPKWNEQIGAFVLNFNKRVTQASVKNFQLTNDEDSPDPPVFLQFGRVGKDVFNMDFRYPISPFQAFAICLSSFDYKLCCE